MKITFETKVYMYSHSKLVYFINSFWLTLKTFIDSYVDIGVRCNEVLFNKLSVNRVLFRGVNKNAHSTPIVFTAQAW